MVFWCCNSEKQMSRCVKSERTLQDQRLVSGLEEAHRSHSNTRQGTLCTRRFFNRMQMCLNMPDLLTAQECNECLTVCTSSILTLQYISGLSLSQHCLTVNLPVHRYLPVVFTQLKIRKVECEKDGPNVSGELV